MNKANDNLAGILPAFTKADENKTCWAYRLYLVYAVSFFLHMPARITFLAIIHSDMILVVLITFLTISSAPQARKLDRASKTLLILFVYSIVEIPVVTYPGSVLHHGLTDFIKGAIFYFFTVRLVRTERRFFVFIAVYLICNTYRVLEPLYMHITMGYWGDNTDMGGIIEPRLQGSPWDVVNANGLAFVIASIAPFYHYWVGGRIKGKVVYAIIGTLLLYAMALTLSRSGLLALALIGLSIFWKSHHKGILLVVGLAVLAVFFSSLNTVQQERYLSIFNHNEPGGASAEGRLTGTIRTFKVALQRPIFGHGMGTSQETNWNATGDNQPAHDLYAEIWEDIGLIGLIMFLVYMKVIIFNFYKAIKELKANLDKKDPLLGVALALQVWMYMNLLFSLASYGLISYEWYLFGGLSVVVLDIAKRKVSASSEKTRLAEISGGLQKHGLADFSKKSLPSNIG